MFVTQMIGLQQLQEADGIKEREARFLISQPC
jgi:hypothetical protein